MGWIGMWVPLRMRDRTGNSWVPWPLVIVYIYLAYNKWWIT